MFLTQHMLSPVKAKCQQVFTTFSFKVKASKYSRRQLPQEVVRDRITPIKTSDKLSPLSLIFFLWGRREGRSL